MTATLLRRALEEDSDSESTAQATATKRVKLCEPQDMLAQFSTLGLPMFTALTKSYTFFSAHAPPA
ncbi:hypothetical protein GGF42_007061, partial [Coemansia sp. RSA 2424]